MNEQKQMAKSENGRLKQVIAISSQTQSQLQTFKMKG
jgi:hypothetical protein